MTTTPETNAAARPHRRGRLKWIAGAAVAALAIGGATHAISHAGGIEKSFRHLSVEADHYGGMMHKAHFFHRKPRTIEEAEKRAERMAKHLAIEVDADAVQTDKLVELARGVARDVFPIRQQMMDMRKEGLDLLTAETVDRAKLDELRSEQFARFDAVGKRLTTALADTADVLSPVQRKALAERIEDWRGHRGRHGWGKRGD